MNSSQRGAAETADLRRPGTGSTPWPGGRPNAPTVYLLSGLTGSGKTTFAKVLEASGVVRLSVDEEVFARNGRYGVDYPDHEYPARERPVVEEIRQRMADLVRAGQDVVLDYGLWLRSEREDYKRCVEQAGGRWRLLYFEVGRGELWRRLNERNSRQDANALTITESELDAFIARFEPPSNEGEEIIPPDQHPSTHRF